MSSSGSNNASLSIKLFRWKVLLARRWWVLLLCMSVTLCAAVILAKNSKDKYESYGRMWISGKIVMDGTVRFDEGQNFINTQLELLKSEKVKWGAVERLQTLRPELTFSEVSISVNQQKGSDLISLQAVGFEPNYTKGFLDAVMEGFLDLRRDARDKEVLDRINQLQDLRSQRDKELVTAQEALRKFEQENNIAVLQELNDSAGKQLARYNTELQNLRVEIETLTKLTVEQQLQSSRRTSSGGAETATGPEGVAPSVARTDFQKNKEKLGLLRLDYEEMSEYLKPAHPKMEELQAQITKLERTLNMNVEQGTEDMMTQRRALDSRREILEKAIKDTEARAGVASRIMAEFDSLKTARDRALKEFDDVGEKLKAVSNTGRVENEPVKILEPATDPFLREQKLVQKIAIGVIAGFLLGLGILFLMDKFDDRINTLTELTDAFDEEILGQIPELPLGRGEKHVPLLHPDDTRHSFAEAYRNVRSSLLFLDTEDFKPRTFVITSSIPSEGKSTLSANLCLTLANAGNRVLLIDADLRRGALSALFGIKAESGMSEMLAGKLDWPAAVKTTDHPHLSIIPRGRATNKAGELFLSPRMDELLREAPKKFDYVFIDSAPILATDDTPTFAPKIDGVLFVVRASFVGARAAKTAIAQLRKRGATVLGLVFNRISETMPDYQYYKYSEYYATKEKD